LNLKQLNRAAFILEKRGAKMSEQCKNCVYVQDIKDDLKEHKEILDRHGEDITDLKADGREYKTEIKNLIEKMDDFISTMKWGLGIFVTVSIFVIGILIKK
jgi:predicted RNase H-like nuclease (RuvC/YqgF family)